MPPQSLLFPPTATARWLLLAAWLGATFVSSSLRAHPLKAAPLDHAHVYAFDQFYLPEDDDAFLTQGGLTLLAELSCASCHAVAPAWQSLIGSKPGPDLSAVGSRLDLDALWRFIRSPQHRKPGTQMPGLFAGNEESDADHIEAIATYLSQLTAASTPAAPIKGEPHRGQALYHQIGCVACHEPASDYRPPTLPAAADLESPSLPSVPIALADDYNLNALAAFLLDPLKIRPASRMPAQHLSPQEAADLAAYLHTDQVPAAFLERQILNLPPQTAERGRQLFEQHRCSQCHRTSTAAAGTVKPSGLPSLSQLNAQTTASGCLSPERRSGTPRYDLSPLQTRALRLAIRWVQTHPNPPLNRAQQLDHHLAALNCYACHDQAGKGGPEFARSIYFATQPRLRPNDDVTALPPSLDQPLPQLSRPALLERLTSPFAATDLPAGTRMPRFHPTSIAPLLPPE